MTTQKTLLQEVVVEMAVADVAVVNKHN